MYSLSLVPRPHPLRGKRNLAWSTRRGWCKTWTLDSGLDSWTGLWTDIWTGFWTDTAKGDDHFQPLTSTEAK